MHARATLTMMAGIVALLIVAGAVPRGARGADEDTTARVREMLRRTQEALRQAQSDNADLTRAKSDAETKLKAATQQLDAAQGSSKAAQAALNAKLTSVQGTQLDLAHKLADTSDRLAAATAKLNDTAKELATRESALALTKQDLEQSKTAGASCESKNLKLYGYAQDVLEAYRKKGVWAALEQKDPVLGLKEVGIENVVQEYRIKFASQKVKP
jgi:hypothetical protein